MVIHLSELSALCLYLMINGLANAERTTPTLNQDTHSSQDSPRSKNCTFVVSLPYDWWFLILGTFTHFGFWIRTGQEAGTSPESEVSLDFDDDET
jgi:hypothetical protein